MISPVDYTWHYYDLVLVGVAACMILGAGVGLATAVPILHATIAGSLLAAAIIGHGLFVNGPVDEPADLSKEVDALN